MCVSKENEWDLECHEEYNTVAERWLVLLGAAPGGDRPKTDDWELQVDEWTAE